MPSRRLPRLVTIRTTENFYMDENSDCIIRIKTLKRTVWDETVPEMRRYLHVNDWHVKRDVVASTSDFFGVMMTSTRWPGLGGDVVEFHDVPAPVLNVLLCSIYGCYPDVCAGWENIDRGVIGRALQNEHLAPAVIKSLAIDPSLVIHVLERIQQSELPSHHSLSWFGPYMVYVDLGKIKSEEVFGSLLAIVYDHKLPHVFLHDFMRLSKELVNFHHGHITSLVPAGGEFEAFDAAPHITAQLEKARAAVVGPAVPHIRAAFNPESAVGKACPELAKFLESEFGMNKHSGVHDLSFHDLRVAADKVDWQTFRVMWSWERAVHPKKLWADGLKLVLREGWCTDDATTVCVQCLTDSREYLAEYYEEHGHFDTWQQGDFEEWKRWTHLRYYTIFTCALTHDVETWRASFGGPRKMKDWLWEELHLLHPRKGGQWDRYTEDLQSKECFPDDATYEELYGFIYNPYSDLSGFSDGSRGSDEMRGESREEPEHGQQQGLSHWWPLTHFCCIM